MEGAAYRLCCVLFFVLNILQTVDQAKGDDPKIPITCGSEIKGQKGGQWVYNLNSFGVGSPLATKVTKGPNAGYTYYVAPCRVATLCGAFKGMVAKCDPGISSAILASSPKGATWAMINQQDPSSGIRMTAGKGPKCGSAGFQRVAINFVCDPGQTTRPRNFTVVSSGTCATTITLRTVEACPKNIAVIFPAWIWTTNIIVLSVVFVYIVAGIIFKVKVKNVPFGCKACPPHAKECPFYVKDGCVFFFKCAGPRILSCSKRICGGLASKREAPEKDTYSKATPDYDALVSGPHPSASSSYGSIPQEKRVPVKEPLGDTPGDIDDKSNPFHGTGF
jgi:hypothetical protein